MRKTKKTLAILALVAMVLTMIPIQVFAASDDTRISGADRIATAIAVADAGWTSADTVILAAADQANLVDALAAASLAGQEDAPILLTFKAALNADVAAKIKALGASKVYVVGAAQGLADAVDAIDGVSVEKLAGDSRWATADAINAKLSSPAGTFVVGYNAVADALSAASYAAANNYAIVLTKADGSVDASKLVGDKTYLVGGTSVVKDYEGATRLGGDDRFATNTAVVEGLTYSVDKVYVANGISLVDALVAAPLAAKAKAAVLLASASDVAAKGALTLTSSSKVIALGGANAVSDAVKGKVAYVAPAELAVESVSAINAKQLKVVFNSAVDEDSAETLANYTFGLQGAASTNVVDGTGAGASLQEDGKTVILTLENTASIANDTKENVVTIDNVKNAAGVEMATKYKDSAVAFKDGELPYLVKIVQTGNKQIKLVFNEPVQDEDGNTTLDGNEISIDNGSVPVKSITADIKAYALLVDTFSALTEGEHTVKVKSAQIEDFVALTNLEQTMSFTAANDTSVPTVTIKEATADKVTLKFSKKVIIPADDNVQFRAVYNNSSNEVLASTNSGSLTKADGTAYSNTLIDEVVVDFPQTLPPGNVSIFIEYDDDDNTTDVIKDGYGIKVPEQTLVANIVTDVTKPTVTKVEAVNATTVDVTFSEEVDSTTSQTAANYVIKDSDDDLVAVSNASLQTGNKRVRLTTANLDGGTYTIEIEDVKDIAVPSKNTMADYSGTFTADDAANPTVTIKFVDGDGVSTDDKIIIKYNEAMATSGAGSVGDKGNYQYALNGSTYVSLDSDDEIAVSGDSKTVTITLEDNVSFTSGVSKVKFGAVTDVAGNKINDEVGYSAAMTAATVGIESAKFIAKDRLEVLFDELLTTVDASEIDLVKDSDGTDHGTVINLTVYSHTTEDNKSKVVFALDQNIGTNGQYEGANVAIKVNGATNTKTVDGIKLGNLAYDGNFVDDDATANKVSDKIAPTLVSSDPIKTADVDADGKIDHIVVTFTEAMKSGSVSLDKVTVDGYTVKDAYTTTAITGASTSSPYRATAGAVDGTLLVIRVTEKDNVDYTNAPTVTIAAGVQDANGNAFTFKAEDTTRLTGSTGAAGTFAVTTQGVDAVLQVAEIQVNTGAGVAGDITVDGVAVTLAGTETAAQVATAVAGATLTNWDVVVKVGTTDVLQFTAKVGAPNASVTFVDTDTTGVTLGAQTNTTAGVAAVAEVATFTITSGASASGTLAVTVNGKVTYVTLAATDDTTAEVATAIAGTLTVTDWTVAAAASTVTITDNDGTASVETDLTGSIR